MKNLKNVHRGFSGMYVTHYAKCDDWEGYFCQSGGGKMFTDSKMDGSQWDEGYLFHIKDHSENIEVIELELTND